MPGLREPGRVLLVSGYDLGQQPLSIARAAAYFTQAGFDPATVDLAVERSSDAALRAARLIAVSTNMHGALRVGVRFAEHARGIAPDAHYCFFGLYADLNASTLLAEVADSVLGAEPEPSLVALADALDRRVPLTSIPALGLRHRPADRSVNRVPYPTVKRDGLPDLERYARLDADGELRIAAAVEASRGCRHRCRHCPIPPVYGGRFFAIPADAVLADVASAVERGARHITFSDPDFLNGPTHALAIAHRLQREHPGLTFDFTAKVEHLLRNRAHLSELVELGCAFAVTAVESLSDRVLAILDKGHTRQDVLDVTNVGRGAGLVLRPTLLPFTPWSTLDDYRALLDWIDDEDLSDQVDAVQLSVRLLVPPSSLLERDPDMIPHLVGPDPANFCIAWRHPDPRMDELHGIVSDLARQAARTAEPGERTFRKIRNAAAGAAGDPWIRRERLVPPAADRVRPPRLTEPWFC